MIISLVIKSILVLVLLLGKQQQVLGDIGEYVYTQNSSYKVPALQLMLISGMFHKQLPLWMSKLLRLVSQLQWRSAGPLQPIL